MGDSLNIKEFYDRLSEYRRMLSKAIDFDDAGPDLKDIKRYYNEHWWLYCIVLKTVVQQCPLQGETTSNTRILDLGAFPYQLTWLMKNFGYDVTAIDIDPGRFQSFVATNDLQVQKCNIETERLPFPEQSFDLIVFTEVFEHLHINPLFTIKEIRRVLKPDGYVVFTTPNLYSLKRIGKFLLGRGIIDHPLVVFKQAEDLGHAGHIREYTSKEIRDILESHDFACSAPQFIGKSVELNLGIMTVFVKFIYDSIIFLIPQLRPNFLFVAQGIE